MRDQFSDALEDGLFEAVFFALVHQLDGSDGLLELLAAEMADRLIEDSPLLAADQAIARQNQLSRELTVLLGQSLDQGQALSAGALDQLARGCYQQLFDQAPPAADPDRPPPIYGSELGQVLAELELISSGGGELSNQRASLAICLDQLRPCLTLDHRRELDRLSQELDRVVDLDSSDPVLAYMRWQRVSEEILDRLSDWAPRRGNPQGCPDDWRHLFAGEGDLVFLHYRDGEGQESRRWIAPRHISTNGQALVAWCYRAQAERNFRFDRIISATLAAAT